MKIQCNACEAAEANVLCCADEAALCWACDEKVHAMNKLASKHQRVPLSSSSSEMPKCDICQESVGYFFCLEDRAVLCRKCDVAIHTANSYVSGHQRFLLTGVRVGLEPAKQEERGSSNKEKLNSVEKIAETTSLSGPRQGASFSVTCEANQMLSGEGSIVGGVAATEASFAGGTTSGSIPDWHMDEFLGLTGFDQNHGYLDLGRSRGGKRKHGDSGWSPILQAVEEDLQIDDCLGQVPNLSYRVPQIPSPPTASGMYWSKSFQNPLSDNSVFVPDVTCTPLQNSQGYQSDATTMKQRRQY